MKESMTDTQKSEVDHDLSTTDVKEKKIRIGK